jgi:hypothetical protein
MPKEGKTPPGSGQKRAKAPSPAASVTDAPSVVEKAVRSIAEAARAAEEHASRSIAATALKDISPAEHLTKQVEEISKAAAGGIGPRWTEQLGQSYATDLTRTLGVTGLAPGISKSMREAVATTGLLGSRAGSLAGLVDSGLVSQGFAKQLRDITGGGLAKQCAGVGPTGIFGGEYFKAFKAMESMMAETKRMETMLGLGKTTMPGVQDVLRGGFLGAVDQQLLRAPLAAKGFFPPDHLASVFGASGALATSRLREAAVAPLAKQIAALGAITNPLAGLATPNVLALAAPNALAGITAPNMLAGITMPNPLAGLTVPNPLVEVLERGREIDDAIDRVAKTWERSALWFILSILSVGQLVALARMERDDVEAVLLDALEAVVTTGTLIAALMATVKKAPSYVTDDQRDDLLHGLEHAQAGEFSPAAGPLTAGLEGALWSAGREMEVIDGDRRLLAKPDTKPIHSVERVVRKLPAKQEFRTFVNGRVFGNLGNPLRHGEQSDRRQRSLFAIVAIAGWVEAFMKVPAADALGTLLSDELASRAGR